VPYLSALEVCSRQGTIQIQVYLTLPYRGAVLHSSNELCDLLQLVTCIN